MKFSAAIVIAAAGAALAQSGLGQIPTCAQPCLDNFLSNGQDTIAGCSALDAKCICENQDFLASIACCLVDNCNAEQQKETVDFAHAMCKTVKVTNLPDEVVCSTGTASASLAASTSGTASADAVSETSNAAPAPTKAPACIIGGVLAAVAML